VQVEERSLEGVDLHFLVRQALTQVAIGENEVILNSYASVQVSTAHVSLMIASNVTVSTRESRSMTYEDAKSTGTAMLSLLGKQIVEAEGTAAGDLILTWSDGSRVEILNTWPTYESFTITHPAGIIVV
jgi:hypothetical protein